MLQLLSIIDPRDNLEKARRPELVKYARSNGLSEVSEAMPAMLIRKKLRGLGLTSIAIPNRVLGAPEAVNHAATFSADSFGDMPLTGGAGIDAADDLARQFAATAPKNPLTMTYNELRRHARAIGVSFERRDNLASMKRKVALAMGVPIGEDPA